MFCTTTSPRSRVLCMGRADISAICTLYHIIQLHITDFKLPKMKVFNIPQSLFFQDQGCYHRLLTTKAKQIWLAFLPAPCANFELRRKISVIIIISLINTLRMLFTYQRFGAKREKISPKIVDVCLRTILAPGK